MIQIEVEDNPNCAASDQFVFNELGKPRAIKAIRAEVGGREAVCEVTGVGRGGEWTPASCVKVADSSDGHAFLIQGSHWGIRLRPESPRSQAWDFEAKEQWGEPFKIYGSEDDIIYETAD